jgi:phosphoribosylformimino-5-aminoimidazole carboxamide ribotide isomerase
MTIIPAIDIINGACVRLVQGNFAQKIVYNTNPVIVAQQFEAAGVKRLHLVDLDGAKAGTCINIKVLQNIAAATNLIIDYGGGIKKDSDVQKIFDAGASMATVGSIAVTHLEKLATWVNRFGINKFIVGADVWQKKIKINGWQQQTDIDIHQFIQSIISIGINNIFCTDITKDGLLQGPAIDLYKDIILQNPTIQLIASGGVSNINDVYALKAIGCSETIIGKAIYEGNITLQQLKPFL